MKEHALAIVKRLKAAGHTAYFAGGWVRDHLLQIPSTDIDLSTSASPDEVIALFSKTIEVGKAFGVVIVIEGGHSFEVASFRKDGLYLDGRHPTTIEKGTAEEDAERRDFTINGLFYDPLTDEIIDFVGGTEDLNARIVRAIGHPKSRFEEDKLRMVRAARFAARFNWEIDQETEAAIKELGHLLFPSVAKERIWQELVKMGENPGLGEAFALLEKLGLLQHILPIVSGTPLELGQRKLQLLSPSIPLPIRLALAFENPELSLFLKEMKTSNEVRDAFDFAIQAIPLLAGDEKDPIHIVPLFAHPHSESLLTGLAELDPSLGSFMKDFQSEYETAISRKRQKKTLLSSQTLMNEGIPPGKKMGLLIDAGEQAAIRHGFTSEREVLDYLKKHPLWKA